MSTSGTTSAASTSAPRRFAGKRALVLGGTSGIGLATCRLLVEDGADVIAFGRSPEKIASAVSSVASDDRRRQHDGWGRFDAECLDVLDRSSMEAAFQKHAGFDYLVCAATGGQRAMGPFMDMDLDGFQGSFAKLWGYANAVRLGVPNMGDGGAVVLVSGSPARRCGSGQIALSCVGGAVENFVRALAAEIAPRHRIVGVSPGLIDTPMFDGMGDGKAEFLIKRTAGNPVPRPGKPDEVAAAILFALENKFVTGTIIDVDGGAVIAR